MGTYMDSSGEYRNYENKVVRLLKSIAEGYQNPENAAAIAAAAAEEAVAAAEAIESVVLYTEQELTDAQQRQARENIGLAVQQIKSPTDADDLIERGIYCFFTGTAPSHIPLYFGRSTAAYGVLTVMPSNANHVLVFQTYTDYSGRTSGRRRDASGNWSAWEMYDTVSASAINSTTTYMNDLDSVKTNGKYVWQSGTAPANWPSSLYGTLFVQGTASFLSQMVIDYSNNVYVRRLFASAWTGWTKLDADTQKIPWTAGKYVGLSGATASPDSPTTYASFRYAVVNCAPGDVFTLSAAGGITPRAYGFLDSSGNVIERAPASATYTNVLLIAPPRAAKLVINDSNSGKTSFINTGAKTLVKTEAEKNKSLYKAFQRVGVIGDSLSVGYMWDTVNSTSTTRMLAYSWPKIIGRECGVPWLNLGTSGQNTLTWCSDETYGKAQLEAAGNKCQLYIIGLGENDAATGTTRFVDLGTTEDIVDDPDTVATTFYGGYNRIIQLIKDVNPTAKIICLTNPNKNTTVSGVTRERESYSAAVRYIATTHYTTEDNVFLLDLEADHDFFFGTMRPIRQDGLAITSHYSAVGYEMIAEYMKRAISAVIQAYQTDFIDVAYIPFDNTDPTADTMTE